MIKTESTDKTVKKRIIIYILYANDCNLVDVESFATIRPFPLNDIDQSYGTIFQVKAINVQDDNEQLTFAKQLIVNQNSIKCQLKSVVFICILSSNCVANLINSDTSPVHQWLVPMAHDTDEDGKAHLMAIYNEPNEINMFRIKFKLPSCTFITLDIGGDICRNIVHYTIGHVSESLYRRHMDRKHLEMKNLTKASFKVFPKRLVQVLNQTAPWRLKLARTKKKVVFELVFTIFFYIESIENQLFTHCRMGKP